MPAASNVIGSMPALVCRSVSSAFSLSNSAMASASPSAPAFCRTAFCSAVSLSHVDLVDQHRNFRGVEAGIDAILGLLLPAEIEDAGDRPAIAVDHAALERGVDLARRGLHDGSAQRLEEVAIDRRDTQLEAGQIGAADLLVQIEVEWILTDELRQVDRIQLLPVEAGKGSRCPPLRRSSAIGTCRSFQASASGIRLV